jgi:hypothetical protein
MKPFLLATFLGLLSYGAGAHRVSKSRSQGQAPRRYSSNRHRMELIGPGGRGWCQRNRAVSYGNGQPWMKAGGSSQPRRGPNGVAGKPGRGQAYNYLGTPRIQ